MSSVYGRPYTPQMVTQTSPNNSKKKCNHPHHSPREAAPGLLPRAVHGRARVWGGSGTDQQQRAGDLTTCPHLRFTFPPEWRRFERRSVGCTAHNSLGPPSLQDTTEGGSEGRKGGCSLGADSLSCKGVGVLRTSSRPPSRERPSGDRHWIPSFKSCSW